MLSKVEFNDLFKPAMQLAFGKTLICRNQDVCSQFSKSHDIDTITLEGFDYSFLCIGLFCTVYNFRYSKLILSNYKFIITRSTYWAFCLSILI